jgi:CxxC-x17-CxxC domain-containing protein
MYMGDFKRQGGFGGNRGGFGGKPRFGGQGNRDFGPRQMFSAVCANCGKTCEVPFKPSGDKPVYCNTCFGKNKANSERTSGPRKDFNSNRPQSFGGSSVSGGQSNDLKSQLDAINSKLDRLVGLLANNPASVKVSKGARNTKDESTLAEVVSVAKKDAAKKTKTASKKKVAKK